MLHIDLIGNKYCVNKESCGKDLIGNTLNVVM